MSVSEWRSKNKEDDETRFTWGPSPSFLLSSPKCEAAIIFALIKKSKIIIIFSLLFCKLKGRTIFSGKLTALSSSFPSRSKSKNKNLYFFGKKLFIILHCFEKKKKKKTKIHIVEVKFPFL